MALAYLLAAFVVIGGWFYTFALDGNQTAYDERYSIRDRSSSSSVADLEEMAQSAAADALVLDVSSPENLMGTDIPNASGAGRSLGGFGRGELVPTSTPDDAYKLADAPPVASDAVSTPTPAPTEHPYAHRVTPRSSWRGVVVGSCVGLTPDECSRINGRPYPTMIPASGGLAAAGETPFPGAVPRSGAGALPVIPGQ